MKTKKIGLSIFILLLTFLSLTFLAEASTQKVVKTTAKVVVKSKQKVIKKTSAIKQPNTTYISGCTSTTGFSTTTGQSCDGLSAPITPVVVKPKTYTLPSGAIIDSATGNIITPAPQPVYTPSPTVYVPPAPQVSQQNNLDIQNKIDELNIKISNLQFANQQLNLQLSTYAWYSTYKDLSYEQLKNITTAPDLSGNADSTYQIVNGILKMRQNEAYIQLYSAQIQSLQSKLN